MKARILIVAAVAAASFTTPADAVAGCATVYPGAPRRIAQTGPDQVQGTLAISNFCDQAAVVDLTLHVNVCTDYGMGDPICDFRPIARSSNPAPAYSENGFHVTTECFEGEHEYAMDWLVRDTAGRVVATGWTDSAVLDCYNDVPAGPGVECPKHIYELCRNISKRD